MNATATFNAHVAACEARYNELMQSAPLSKREINATLKSAAGVYMFFEHGVPMYAGRTNDMKRRYGEHTWPSSCDNKAPLAFNLLKKEQGWESASYQTKGSRKELAKHPGFAEQKQRVANMEVRFVREADPVRQAMLEMYAAEAAGTGNCFDNH